MAPDNPVAILTNGDFPRSVLITVGRLDGMTGSEIVTRELAEHFASRDARVIIVAHSAGADVEAELRLRGDVSVMLSTDPALDERLRAAALDFVWLQHLVIPTAVFELDAEVPIVFNHMSLRVAIESPLLPELECALATVVVFNSPHVRDALVEPGVFADIDSERLQLFANPAPDGFAGVARGVAGTRPRVAVISNHIPPEVREAMSLVGDAFEITLVGSEREIGAVPQRVDPALLAEIDVVVTIGKTVQYAVAAGKAVYCYDHFGGPGWLSRENFVQAQYENFSGLGFGKKSADVIAAELTTGWQAAVSDTSWMREKFGSGLFLSARLGELISYAFAHPRDRTPVPARVLKLHSGVQQVAAKWFAAMSIAERYRARAFASQAEASELRRALDAAALESSSRPDPSSAVGEPTAAAVSRKPGSGGHSEEGWRVRQFPLLSTWTSRSFSLATLSRAESGIVHWEKPNPRRSFVRGAAYDHGAQLIASSQRLGGMNSDMVLSVNPAVLTQRELIDARSSFLAGRWVYAGAWMNELGNFLMETLPALWPLLDGGASIQGVAAHRFTSRRTFEWQFELTRMLANVEIRVIDDEPAVAEELLVADRPYISQVAISPIAAKVWDRISESAAIDYEPILAESRVFLSRTRSDAEHAAAGIRTGREYANAAEVDSLFESRGFRVVYPETMPIVDQVRLARSAKLLVGQSGDALLLSAFCMPGARVIELGDSRTKSRMSAAQRAVSAVKQQLVAHLPFVAAREIAFDVEQLAKALDRLLGRP